MGWWGTYGLAGRSVQKETHGQLHHHRIAGQFRRGRRQGTGPVQGDKSSIGIAYFHAQGPAWSDTAGRRRHRPKGQGCRNPQLR